MQFVPELRAHLCDKFCGSWTLPLGLAASDVATHSGEASSLARAGGRFFYQAEPYLIRGGNRAGENPEWLSENQPTKEYGCARVRTVCGPDHQWSQYRIFRSSGFGRCRGRQTWQK